MRRRLPLPFFLIVSLAAAPAMAENTVIQRENVRYEYARVLRVTPVYQTLNATSVEQRCDEDDRGSRISRVAGAIRGAIGREEREQAQVRRNCQAVQVQRQFHRPIAYDVDYTYRGAKYRSRLGEDPGRVLRIRVSVMPMP